MIGDEQSERPQPFSPFPGLIVERAARRADKRKIIIVWLLILLPLLGVLLALGLFALESRSYNAVASVRLVNHGRDYDRSDRIGKTGLNDELALLRSNSFRQRVLDDLAPQIRQRLLPKVTKDSLDRKGTPPAAKALRTLSAANLPAGDMITFTFPARDPEVALAVVGAAMRAAQERHFIVIGEHFKRAGDVLQPRLDELAADVEKMQQDQDRRRVESGLEQPGGSRRVSLQNLTGLGRQARKQQRRLHQRRIAGAKAQEEENPEVKRDPELVLLEHNLYLQQAHERDVRERILLATSIYRQTGAVPDSLLPNHSSVLLQDLRARLHSQQANYASLASTLGPREISLIQARTAVAESEKAIAAESGRLLTSAQAELASEQSAVARLQSLVREKRAAADAHVISEATIQVNDVEMDVDESAVDTMHQLLATRAITGVFQAKGVDVVDDPHLVPVDIGTWKEWAKSGFKYGGVLAIAVLVAWRVLSERRWSITQLELAMDAEVAVVYPWVRKRGPRRDRSAPLAGNHQEFTASAQHLADLVRAGDAAVVLVTSALPQAGRTTIASTLARSLAERGEHVLLVDTDTRNPSLHHALGLPAREGLLQVLDGTADFDNVVKRDALVSGLGKLDVLVAGIVPDRESKDLQSSALDGLLSTWRLRYRYIVLDAAVIGSADVLYLSDRAELLLFVAQHAKVRGEDLSQAKRVLKTFQKPLAWTVVNGFQMR